MDSSLRRLGVAAIDLLQLHEPNPSIQIEETVGALTGLVDAGKVRFIGGSNFSMAQLQEAQKAAGKYPIVSNQIRYNIIDRTIEKAVLGYCQANRVTVIAYCPLARSMRRIRDCDPAVVDAKIQFRHRNYLDELVRRHTPGPVLAIAKRVVRHLPRVVRRHVICEPA